MADVPEGSLMCKMKTEDSINKKGLRYLFTAAPLSADGCLPVCNLYWSFYCCVCVCLFLCLSFPLMYMIDPEDNNKPSKFQRASFKGLCQRFVAQEHFRLQKQGENQNELASWSDLSLIWVNMCSVTETQMNPLCFPPELAVLNSPSLVKTHVWVTNLR